MKSEMKGKKWKRRQPEEIGRGLAREGEDWFGFGPNEKGRRSCRLDPLVETEELGYWVQLERSLMQVDCDTRKKRERVLARSKLRFFFF
jgi:hypothetical protein